MGRFLLCIYSLLIAQAFYITAQAQEEEGYKKEKIGKIIECSRYNELLDDTWHIYYIASDARKIDRFIKKGHWKRVDKRYTPYNDITLAKIDYHFNKTLSTVLSKEQKDSLNPIGKKRNIFMSEFYIFVESNKRFVKLELRGSTAKYLSNKQIYKILRLYSNCKLPVLPVIGQFKEKEYYITGASVDKIE